MLRRRCVEAAIDVVTNRRKVGRQSPKLEMERRSMKQRRLLANSQEAGGTGAGAPPHGKRAGSESFGESGRKKRNRREEVRNGWRAGCEERPNLSQSWRIAETTVAKERRRMEMSGWREKRKKEGSSKVVRNGWRGLREETQSLTISENCGNDEDEEAEAEGRWRSREAKRMKAQRKMRWKDRIAQHSAHTPYTPAPQRMLGSKNGR